MTVCDIWPISNLERVSAKAGGLKRSNGIISSLGDGLDKAFGGELGRYITPPGHGLFGGCYQVFP
jgi:hypothetical protein